MNNQTNAPPAVDYAPLELQAELIAMQELTIEELLTVGQSQIPESQQELHLQLLEKNQNNELSESDRLLLRRRSPPQASLRVSADYLTLKKAYNYAILKYKSYSILNFEQLLPLYKTNMTAVLPMLYIDIFLECHQAILNGILITRQNQRDKEYHFQDWFGARLTNLQSILTFNFEQPGRNTYPDFRMIQNPEGYEIKGLEYPGRYKDYDSNSQVPRGYHNGITIFYVFGRYPKNVSSKTYPVHDLVICHGDFINADHNYVHKNKSFRGFGSYGDILIRDRKMYVAPTPFGLLNGVESQTTLILPSDYPVDNRLVSVSEFSRMEVSQMVVGYSFDMQTNIIQPQLMPNPFIGQVHNFIAYRSAILQSINALGQQVSLKSLGEQEELLNEAEKEEKST